MNTDSITIAVCSEHDAEFLRAVALEEIRARATHGDFASLHEAYAVLLEETDEFKAEVWKKRGERDGLAIYCELVQIAAMAMKASRLVKRSRP